MKYAKSSFTCSIKSANMNLSVDIGTYVSHFTLAQQLDKTKGRCIVAVPLYKSIILSTCYSCPLT